MGYALSLQLSVSHGTIPVGQWSDSGLGDLGLVVWLKAVDFPRAAGARCAVMEVLASGEAVHRRLSPPGAAVQDLVLALEAIGWPERAPRVRERPDTSNVWTRLVLHGSLGEATRTLHVNTLASGFQGEDAGALRAILDKLATLAGVDPGGVLRSLLVD